jgi:transposase-like protein
MDKTDGVYSREFKLSAVQRVMAGEKVRTVAEELGIRAKLRRT